MDSLRTCARSGARRGRDAAPAAARHAGLHGARDDVLPPTLQVRIMMPSVQVKTPRLAVFSAVLLAVTLSAGLCLARGTPRITGRHCSQALVFLMSNSWRTSIQKVRLRPAGKQLAGKLSSSCCATQGQAGGRVRPRSDAVHAGLRPHALPGGLRAGPVRGRQVLTHFRTPSHIEFETVQKHHRGPLFRLASFHVTVESSMITSRDHHVTLRQDAAAGDPS